MEDAQKLRRTSYRWIKWLSIVLLLVVTWLFGLPLLERMQQRFERTAFEQIIRQLNVSCAQRLLEAKATENSHLRDWLGRNPMACLEGETLSGMNYQDKELSVTKQPLSSWLFETQSGSLRYRWKYSEQLISMGPEQDIVRYRLAAEFADTNQNGKLDDDEAINGLYLQRVHPFRWRESSEN